MLSCQVNTNGKAGEDVDQTERTREVNKEFAGLNTVRGRIDAVALHPHTKSKLG